MLDTSYDRTYPLDQEEMDQITTIENGSNLTYLGGRTGSDKQGHSLPLYIFISKGFVKPDDDAYAPGPAFKEMDAHGLKVSAIYYAAMFIMNLQEPLDAN